MKIRFEDAVEIVGCKMPGLVKYLKSEGIFDKYGRPCYQYRVLPAELNAGMGYFIVEVDGPLVNISVTSSGLEFLREVAEEGYVLGFVQRQPKSRPLNPKYKCPDLEPSNDNLFTEFQKLPVNQKAELLRKNNSRRKHSDPS